MELDGALGIVALLLHCRVVLCLLGSSVIAFALVQLFPWFTGIQGLVFAALGLLPGLMWNEGALQPPVAPAARTTTTLVAVSSAAIFAALWGAISSTSFHSAIAGAAVLACAAWGWFRYSVVSQVWLSPGQGLRCIAAATLAYPLTALLAHNAF